jgi:hypothetical protein
MLILVLGEDLEKLSRVLRNDDYVAPQCVITNGRGTAPRPQLEDGANRIAEGSIKLQGTMFPDIGVLVSGEGKLYSRKRRNGDVIGRSMADKLESAFADDTAENLELLCLPFVSKGYRWSSDGTCGLVLEPAVGQPEGYY